MSILSHLTGGLIDGVAKAVDTFVSTPDEKAAHHLKILALQLQEEALRQKPLLEQIETNKLEARHASVFVAGWRPATGWACGACMVGIAVAGTYGWLKGVDVEPILYLYGSTIAPVHLGMLGLRSFDKLKGIHRDSVKGRNA